MKKPFFSSAIVRTPSSSMVNGITTADLGRPDYQLALVQHQAYIDALEFIGLNVTVLPAAEEFPDACFVEDVAVLTNEFAIICNPGADSRRGEKDLILSAIKVPPPSPRKSASSNHPLMSSPTPSPNSSTASDFSTMKRMESCLRKEKWEKIFLLFWKVYFV